MLRYGLGNGNKTDVFRVAARVARHFDQSAFDPRQILGNQETTSRQGFLLIERLVAFFFGAYSDRLFHRTDEDFAITHIPRFNR